MKTRTIDLGGPIHLADFGGSGPPVVLVHGLGGSHVNWMAVGPRLAERARVLAPDLIGFGRTPLADRKPGVESNVALLGRFLREEVREPAVLVGNSMGGLVALLTAAAFPEQVARLVLVGAALPIPLGTRVDPTVASLFALYAVPLVGELVLGYRLNKVGPEQALRETLRLCGVDPKAVDAPIWEAAAALARERARWPWSNRAFLGSARSLLRQNAQASKVHEKIRAVRAKTLLMHGTTDRLVSIEVSRSVARMRPDWTLSELPGAGHMPQLQVPDRWLAALTAWLDGAGAG
ncbi:MAG: alpha/beta hydrolase [Byssovorax sp.]